MYVGRPGRDAIIRVSCTAQYFWGLVCWRPGRQGQVVTGVESAAEGHVETHGVHQGGRVADRGVCGGGPQFLSTPSGAVLSARNWRDPLSFIGLSRRRSCRCGGPPINGSRANGGEAGRHMAVAQRYGLPRPAGPRCLAPGRVHVPRSV